jgi:four helix bundle protein
MDEQEFKNRTKELAKEIAFLVLDLPPNRVTEVFGRPLLRSGSSVGANYRSACRARSDAEMVAKFGIAEEEADEAQYWLELLVGTGFLDEAQATPIHRELDQIIAMLVASRRTLRNRISDRGNQSR